MRRPKTDLGLIEKTRQIEAGPTSAGKGDFPCSDQAAAKPAWHSVGTEARLYLGT